MRAVLRSGQAFSVDTRRADKDSACTQFAGALLPHSPLAHYYQTIRKPVQCVTAKYTRNTIHDAIPHQYKPCTHDFRSPAIDSRLMDVCDLISGTSINENIANA